MAVTKVDNASTAHDAKLQLRRNVLQEIEPANVLDCFCGHGAMWREAWCSAASYVGCDERPIKAGDPPRFFCDNRVLLRSIDLHEFNVFDFDAYGSPWVQMVILAARRRWLAGERGAVVLTDGTAMGAIRGGRETAFAELAGIESCSSHHHSGRLGQKRLSIDRNAAIRGWLAKSRVRCLRRWEAQATSSAGIGYSAVNYQALLFEGLPD